MNYFKWAESGIKKFRWFDISLIKLSTAAFTLMVAKLWDPLLSLDWGWYLLFSLVFAIRPFYQMFKK